MSVYNSYFPLPSSTPNPTLQRIIAEGEAAAAQQQAQEQGGGVGSSIGQLAGLGGSVYLGNQLFGSGAGATGAGIEAAGGIAAPAVEAAGGVAAGAGAAASPWAMGGFGTAGNAYAPLLGAALAGDVLINKRHGGRGAAQGALAGVGMGSYFGPYGALAGALLGGGIGYFGNFGDENRFLTEYNRSQALRDKGINWDLNTQAPSKGRSIGDLIAEAEANKAAGKWGNVEFARSRDEKDLKAEDIWGYSAFGEKYGNDWLKKFSEDQRRQVAQKVLDSGAAQEHHGTVDINFNPELDTALQAILNPPKEAKK